MSKSLITKANQKKVFKSLMKLVVEKGSRSKMVGSLDVAQDLNVERIEVEAVLSLFIKSGIVRYYKNAKGYTYYGITKQAYARYDAKQTVKTEKEVV